MSVPTSFSLFEPDLAAYLPAFRAEGIRAEGPYAADTVWKRPCDAIVASSDWIAIGVLHALRQRGIAVPDAVAITYEMIHETRIIPLDNRPAPPEGLKQWMGVSRGRWEGDTLVVTSRYARQAEPYGTLAYGLVLKEVGGLFQTLYLVGEYLELAPCALGGGTSAGSAPGGGERADFRR